MQPRSRLLMFISVALSLSLVLSACGGDDDEEAEDATTTTTSGKVVQADDDVRQGGTIAYAAEQEPSGFNYLTGKDAGLQLRHIMRHLWPYAYQVRPDFTLQTMPLLAAPAKVVSESPFVVEWKIADAAVWDDGVPVSSDDFEWVYQSCNEKVDPGEATAKDEETGETVSALDCASTSGYNVASGFEKVDKKTVRMTFPEEYVEYEALFGDPMPPSHVGKKRKGGWNTGFDADPGPSAGPYRLGEAVKGDHYTLVRNEKYWGPKPKLDSIVFRAIPDPASHPEALRNDEVQLIYPQPQVDLIEQLEAIPSITTETNLGSSWEHLDFNFKNDLLAVKEVRQAVAFGIDRDRYVNTLMKPLSKEAKRLDNRVFVSNQEGYEAHGRDFAARSTRKATAALEKAGFTKGQDGVYAKAGKRLSFRLRVNSPNPLREQLAQLIQADLKGVGIEINIQTFSAPENIGSVGSKGDFDLMIFAWTGTPFEVGATEQIFSSASGSNFSKYASPSVDAAIKDAGKLLDEKDRVKALNAIDEQLWADMANIPLFQKPAGVLAYSNRYGNIRDNTTSEGLFWKSSEWGLKATPG